ncbi:MAG: acyl-CoA dehydrogenase [Mucilaginibacter sp.]|nr:acyl-CoA dehydrogenase [Mucilaginibacter sp.]
MTTSPVTDNYFENAGFCGLRDCLEKIRSNAAKIDDPQTAPVEEFEWLAASGVMQVTLPGEALDFEKPDTASLLHLFKLVGQANLSVGRIYEGHVNALYLVHLYADEAQKKEWYRAVREDAAIFGVWNTQNQHGLTYLGVEGGLVLEGAKTFCSGVAIITHALVTGNIDLPERKGWQMMILDMAKISDDRIDRNSWKTLGMRASGSFTTDFSGYKVQQRELLGMPGDYLRQPHFNGGAIRFAAVQLGGAAAIAGNTLDYLASLGRTDDPIQKIRLAAILTQIVTGELWLKQAGRHFDEWVSLPGRSSELIAFANMTRTVIEEIGISVMNESNRCVGARGLMASSPLERLHRDLTFYLRQPAPDATRIAVADYFINNLNQTND